MADVTAARMSTARVSLVARRHVDFKRVCSCTCRPWRRRPAHLTHSWPRICAAGQPPVIARDPTSRLP